MIHLLKKVKRKRADKKWFESFKTHHSRLEPTEACAYSKYLKECREAFHEPLNLSQPVEQAVNEFNEKGFTSWWDEENGRLAQAVFEKISREEQSDKSIWGESGRYATEIYQGFPEIEQLFHQSLGQFLRGVYRAHFKIFYGILYKSQRRAVSPGGSQLWHADGGPGTCINVMFVLKDLAPKDGAMELLPWKFTEEIVSKERPEVPLRLEAAVKNNPNMTRLDLREIKTEFFREHVEASHSDRIEQPTGRAGLVIPFRNNVLHKGGFPEEGHTRYVCIFHIYPSDKPTDWEMYRLNGVPKRASYPKDPGGDF